MDTMNKYLVTLCNDGVTIMLPPRRMMTPEQAVIFAAWIVVLADPDGLLFPQALEAVKNT